MIVCPREFIVPQSLKYNVAYFKTPELTFKRGFKALVTIYEITVIQSLCL